MALTTAATFCATLVDEWRRAGVTDAVIAPGSRSTPLALAMAARADLRVHVFHDERSAAFAALGLGLATGRPAVLLCTSGTAAAELHAAVIEAHQAEVPLVVCTADRPPELRDVGAPQTIDQTGLYGRAVRWFHDPGVPDDAMRAAWRSIAARAVADAWGPRPGPVHLNLPFRDPLVGHAGELPPGRSDSRPWHHSIVGEGQLDSEQVRGLLERIDVERGVIVAGHGSYSPESVRELAVAAGWPVLADPRSGARVPSPTTIASFDALLRHRAFATDHRPAVVLRLGAPPASKVLNDWLASAGALEVQLGTSSAWSDPDHRAAVRVVAEVDVLCDALAEGITGATGTPWLARWRRADDAARTAITSTLAMHAEPTEPGVAADVIAHAPDGARIVVSSSMPIRDVEWYSPPRTDVRVHANRGANGIDGVVSTAVGVALADPATPVSLLIGDVALLHDTNGLLGLSGRAVNLTIVAVDNDGGGIFSFLPQATAVAAASFELLFGTPHHVDLAALAALHGIDTTPITTAADFAAAFADATTRPGVQLLHVRTDRAANVAVHAELNQAVLLALDAVRA